MLYGYGPFEFWMIFFKNLFTHLFTDPSEFIIVFLVTSKHTMKERKIHFLPKMIKFWPSHDLIEQVSFAMALYILKCRDPSLAAPPLPIVP